MVASIGAVASPSQGASYYERDGYYAKDDPAHREASAWAGRGAAELGLEGPVDPETFKAVLEGTVPDGSGRHLGRTGKGGAFEHRPGRDITFSAPKSVSLTALVGGDARIVDAHDKAVKKSLAWFEKNAAETRLRDSRRGRMVRAGNQKTVVATFTHDTSRNLDPMLHTHSVIANMLLGADGKWRTMANERLYRSKMLLGALYRIAGAPVAADPAAVGQVPAADVLGLRGQRRGGVGGVHGLHPAEGRAKPARRDGKGDGIIGFALRRRGRPSSGRTRPPGGVRRRRTARGPGFR